MDGSCRQKESGAMELSFSPRSFKTSLKNLGVHFASCMQNKIALDLRFCGARPEQQGGRTFQLSFTKVFIQANDP